MYQKRIVASALALMAVVMMAAGVLATIDPFGAEVTWLVWVALVIGGIVGIGASATIAIDILPKEKEFFSVGGGLFLFGAFIGLFVVGYLGDSSATNLRLGWYGYVGMLVTYLLNGFVAYLAYETPAQRANKRLYRQIAGLRR